MNQSETTEAFGAVHTQYRSSPDMEHCMNTVKFTALRGGIIFYVQRSTQQCYLTEGGTQEVADPPFRIPFVEPFTAW